MISGETKVLTLFGHPVAQALSPALVNERLAARGLDAVLVALDVAPTGLVDALAGLSAIGNWAGSVVTMPHKQSIVPLLAKRSPAVSLSGACNVVRSGPVGLAGDMLDGVAMCAAIEQTGGDIALSTVGLIGAGCAASAIAFALAARGVRRIAICSRRIERVKELAVRLQAENFGTLVVATHDLTDCDVIVNATPVGMHRGDALPISAEAVYSTRLVADVVITQRDTPLIALAKAVGVRTVRGIDMLAAQVELLIDFILGGEPDGHRTRCPGPCLTSGKPQLW